MNMFGIRYVKVDGRYRGEYRLAHWSGYRSVLNSNDETMLFAHATDAYQAATTALLGALNGNLAYWRGPNRDDARQAAEAVFRSKNG